jgi:hypothetical protein
LKTKTKEKLLLKFNQQQKCVMEELGNTMVEDKKKRKTYTKP